ncbi:unnamed protein product [Vitrella brassicaformis CCMP3155]|uniref:Uncharacterized protein n=1 Tax=Vitrella brassicaformis (strain CCMP3155) TaxID=1169540 RepID=A0A0G4FRM1_VITBC|nr:unnamed protein product [Vitrella brassicaformis CCMP3155]|mmetsp:Transcript_42551/g.106207  ORF Transcript_42551/g.106207 Transcript_42551/m.106207 type:complete len:86 (+) Transcript_42551:265-522(+)|eukprot:CEM17303.1 unnamed protein product [Vitrella brassicaformis CCMP3155]
MQRRRHFVHSFAAATSYSTPADSGWARGTDGGNLSVGNKVWVFGLVNGPEYNGLSGWLTARQQHKQNTVWRDVVCGWCGEIFRSE